ncbi:MAG: hypothetical protein CMK35_05920 [Porticoccaceae bacterium]|jgi:hypothetical protein|nr:hypothetical protein [Porticoccaceae bacterium]
MTDTFYLRIMNRKLCLLSLLLFFLIPGFAKELNIENLKQHADLEIYYSAFPSSFISPEIANSNRISQRKDLGIVNIVGLKRYGNYVPLAIHGNVQNIFQQKQILNFNLVQEGDALYYLASFNYENEDFLTFSIWIKPQSATQENQIKFQKIMYID